MPRLIDAEKADRRIEQFLCGGCDDYHNCGNCLAHKALSFLRGEPTVDAEPVVRCKDCIHWYVEDEFCYYMRMGDPRGYCSLGKGAKTDEDG